MMLISDFREFAELEFAIPNLFAETQIAVALAESLNKTRLRLDDNQAPLVELAMFSAMQSVNSLLAAAGGMCKQRLPHSQIYMTTDGSGQLIYRCGHANVHRWNLSGQPIP